MRSGRLHRSPDWSKQPNDPLTRPREGCDPESDCVVTPDGNHEQLLTLLGVAGQRPVRESPTLWLVHDANDAAWGCQGQPGRPKGHHHGRPEIDGRGVRKDIEPPDLVALPSLQAS